MSLEIKKDNFFKGSRTPSNGKVFNGSSDSHITACFHQSYLCILEDGEKQDEHLYLADLLSVYIYGQMGCGYDRVIIKSVLLFRKTIFSQRKSTLSDCIFKMITTKVGLLI